MTACRKCGFDEEMDACKYCGAVEHNGILGNYGGTLKTICCRVNPLRPPKILPKDREGVNKNG